MAADAEAFEKRACNVFREVSQVPVPIQARIHPQGSDFYEVEVKWSQRDLDRGKKVTFAKSYTVKNSPNLELVTTSNFQRDATNVQKESYSGCGTVKAVLIKDKSSKAEENSEPQQFIEIWQSNYLVKSFNVKELFGKKHGKIHDNDHFGSFQLCSDGSKLVYIAEKKDPESVSYFKKTVPDEKEDKEKPEKGTEYQFKQSWGEQLTDVCHSVGVVLDIASEQCTVLECADDVSASHAQWVPHSNTQLVFIGYDNQPWKLGFVYCLNRRSALYCVDLEKEEGQMCVALTDHEKYRHSPRFNPQATKLVYLETEASQVDQATPHVSCATMKMVDWNTKEIKTIVEVVSKPLDNGFTGIYAVALPTRCWDNTGTCLYFSDLHCSFIDVVAVDTNSCHAQYLKLGSPRTYSVMDVADDVMVLRCAEPSRPSDIIVARLPKSAGDDVKEESLCIIASTSLSFPFSWNVVDLSREGSIPYQAIFMLPVDVKRPPLIVYPHGGPHMAYPADYIYWVAGLVGLGFAVLLVNYRGSSGFGQDSIFSLPGNVGNQDVKDVQHAAETIIKEGGVDGSHVTVMGGSHGGFLATHLIGQYPDFYTAAFIRNPVIDIAPMMYVSDIPDWGYVESGCDMDLREPPTANNYTTMLACSPIVYIKQIKAPVILCLGGEDHRVHPSQGRKLYSVMKAQNKDIKLFWYPKDCHPLSSVDTDADCFMHCALHFHKHCFHGN